MRQFDEGDVVQLLEAIQITDEGGRIHTLSPGTEGLVIIANAPGIQVVEVGLPEKLPDGRVRQNYVELNLSDAQLVLIRPA